MLDRITSFIKRYTPTRLEGLIPGIYEINRDNLKTGYLWVIGTIIGYLFNILPGLIIHGVYILLHKRRKEKQQVEALIKDRSIVFKQLGTYKGGIKGFPQPSEKEGILYVFEDSIGFQDKNITWDLPYSRIINAYLDKFQVGGFRGIVAQDQAQSLQEVRNNLVVYYLDQEEVEREAKFHIHGAGTIYGEGEKAFELLNYILEFKGQFYKA